MPAARSDVRWALRTHAGLQRENNEDYAVARPDLGLFVIADGMGGHVAGEVASHVAVQAVVERISRGRPPLRIRDEAARLAEAVLIANEAVLRESLRRDLQGMGTTLTAVSIRGRTASLAHVGDTRAWLVFASRGRQLTRDHTLVELLVESGQVARAEAEEHPDKHVLTQAIGPSAEVEPQVSSARIAPGGRLLLSTDGLHDVVPERELLELARAPDLEAATRALVDRANALGGPDNVTVVLVEP
jgi:serine/threonine protein phosphatase PrpC